MVEREIGDSRHQRPVDDIGGVESASKAHLEDARIRGRARESDESGRRRNLEKARFDPRAGVDHLR